jgi:hypothetical protein
MTDPQPAPKPNEPLEAPEDDDALADEHPGDLPEA